MSILYGVYGVVLVVGGVLGFRKAKSLPSLIAGVISGDLAIAAGVLMDLHHPAVALRLGAVLAGALTLVFVRRLAVTRKAMPAVPIIALSLIVLAASLAPLLTAAHHA